MDLHRDTCDQAVRSRNRRFDGGFFVAVTSTGIYCRTVCAAQASRFENYRIFEAKFGVSPIDDAQNSKTRGMLNNMRRDGRRGVPTLRKISR